MSPAAPDAGGRAGTTRSRPAPAKINLALVVGPLRPDGKHEVATVYQRIDLADTITLESRPGAAGAAGGAARGAAGGALVGPPGVGPGTEPAIVVEGFGEDTLVTRALEELAAAAAIRPAWRARIDKRIPVAAGLGGGSSDAAAALALANEALGAAAVSAERLHAIATALGADVPFFLTAAPQLGSGDGAELAPLALPLDYAVLLLRPTAAVKESTGAIYAAFAARDGALGWAARRAALVAALAAVRVPRDLATLPPNDLATSPLARRILAAGAFRADVTGAGPLLYGLFDDVPAAIAAAIELAPLGTTWIARPTC